MTNYSKTLVAAFLIAAAIGCSRQEVAFSKFPGTKDGARALIGEFMKPCANLKKLTMELRPTKEDYRAFYADETSADRAEVFFDKLWNSEDAVVAPKDGQNELKLFSATIEDLKNDSGESSEFATSFRSLAATDNLRPAQTVYAFKFIKPGESVGMAFEGLTHINGRWRLFPKPWRSMESK